MADPRPIYARIAAELRDHIGSGALAEGDRAPSTNELSAFHSVNPTTSGKALAELVADGLLEKRRGLGMFVVPGARGMVLARRRSALAADFIRPLLTEARALGIDDAALDELIAAERKQP
ncbi:GntR family transcriptional regulator [Corynebacterium xerosis]|uniref:GntR family transcriptional regulator n=1 Tax=Corynebacterium xerosis TaxID=1725 RepID=A0A494RSW0_9CORY|nr:GntR family transcriptional regulator [Corynebacterium xerosis]AYJ33934.1 GntR family transcriptional regulator [Corynebacterium xerosis]NMF09395.1 GntR family transcriptional regulator [Corynebacterium xerosis]